MLHKPDNLGEKSLFNSDIALGRKNILLCGARSGPAPPRQEICQMAHTAPTPSTRRRSITGASLCGLRMCCRRAIETAFPSAFH